MWSPNFLKIALASHARVACVALAMSRPSGSCGSARHPAYAYVDLVIDHQADGQLPLVAERIKGFKERRKLKGETCFAAAIRKAREENWKIGPGGS